MSEIKISINDFKNSEKGIGFVKNCIQSSMSSQYEDGYYYFSFILDDTEIVYETQPVGTLKHKCNVAIEVDDSLFNGCENVEQFETLPEYQAAFTDVCERLYDKAVEIVNYEC